MNAMAFRGLFVGIDRYQSPDIRDLLCAARDATALEALFADTLGGLTVLLTDQEATRLPAQGVSPSTFGESAGRYPFGRIARVFPLLDKTSDSLRRDRKFLAGTVSGRRGVQLTRVTR